MGEDLEAAEEVAKLTLKSRARRHSSGDKKSDRRSPRGRLNSTDSRDSCSSGSDNEEDNDDKLSLCDFEIEEKDEVTSPPQISSPVMEAKSDKSFFSSLLNQTSSQNASDPPKNEKKKPQKLSQKERKRLSIEAENPKPKTETVTSPKASWVGWGSGNSKISSSPSLADIIKMERKSPPDIKTIPNTPSTEDFSSRKVCEPEKKPEKRTSWKKIDLNTNIEKPKTATPTKTSNPWKIPTSPPNNNSVSFSSLESPLKGTDESFHQIMKEDVKRRKIFTRLNPNPSM